MDREPYSVTARLEFIMDNKSGAQLQGRKNSDDISESASGSHATETYRSEESSNLPTHPQVNSLFIHFYYDII